MKRCSLIGVSALALLAGCTHGQAGTVSSGTGSSPPKGSPVTTASPARLPALILRADQSMAHASWQVVLTVPFGKGKGQLGYQPPRQSGPTEPTAFAVAPDGSFWIVDPGKARIAHFGASGTFLGESGITTFLPQDLVFVGGLIYVLLDEQTGRIAEVKPGGTLAPAIVAASGKSLLVSELYSAASGLVALSGGYADSIGQTPTKGPAGFVRVDPSGSGRTELLPGLPIGRATMVSLSTSPVSPDEDFEITYLRSGPPVVQPVTFKLLVEENARLKRIRGVFGPGNLLPFDGDVSMYVTVSPSKPGDQERYAGSRWFLRMGRSPLQWERLPDPGVPDEAQRRHIAIDSDGRVYLMVLTKGGAQIYRRP